MGSQQSQSKFCDFAPLSSVPRANGRTRRRREQRDSSLAPDQTKARALEALEPISNKLMGLQVTSDPESLGPKEVTIEEQVERLIREARNPQNLGSMYVGVSRNPFFARLGKCRVGP
mgnify:CR=1 FL=1